MAKEPSWFRYVPLSLLDDYHRLGWIYVNTTYDGAYVVFLMQHLCCCRDPETPPPEPKRSNRK